MHELTGNERRLVQAVQRGTWLDLSEAPDRGVRGEVIRELVRGRLADDPDPRGVRLTGATVTGECDLGDVPGELALGV